MQKAKKKRPTIRNIVALLDTTLRVRSIKDASRNGLQVRSSKSGEIKKVGFAVDACYSTFEMANKLGIDLLVVHHGIKWRPQKDRDLEKLRETYLRKHDIALYAAHLPLDLHEDYGNNIRLSRMLGVQEPQRFGKYHGIKIGYAGTLARALTPASAAAVLNRALGTSCRVFAFGRKQIRTIGIISGGGGSMLKDAVREKLDCFLVGEIDLAVHNAAKEYGMNIIAAGHYATETVGVRALMPLIRDAFGAETVFVDDPKEI